MLSEAEAALLALQAVQAVREFLMAKEQIIFVGGSAGFPVPTRVIPVPDTGGTFALTEGLEGKIKEAILPIIRLSVPE